MKRIFTILIFCCLAVVFLNAQPEKTSSGFNAGSSTENGISVVIGQPFSAIFGDSGYEFAEGVTQAQLVTETYGANVAYGAGYHDAWFDFDASTAEGIHYGKLYTPYGAPKKYDLLRKLTLSVLSSTACGNPVVDAGHTKIARAGVFNAPGFTDVPANESTYGRLYTWYSAVGLPEDGSGTLTPDANGYVQGACPAGWHIPTAVEKAALDALNTEDIRTAELWIMPNSNTNSTGFTSLPAGMYNAAHACYEQIFLNTGYWSLSNGTSVPTTVMALPYYCSHPMEKPVSGSDMLSVRCVKNN